MAITLEQWAERLKVAATTEIPKALKQAMIAGALRGEREAKIRVGAADRNTRSGRLRSSIVGAVVNGNDGPAISLRAGGAPAVRYARIQELGGIVRPTRSKFLAIPVGPALTAAGVSRYKSPRDVPGLTFAMSRRGQPMLIKAEDERKGNRRVVQAGDVWYILRRQVKVPSRPYLRPALDIAAMYLPGDVKAGIGAAIKGGSGGG